MTVRARVILVIVLTNLIIILFSVFSGIAYVRKNMEKFIETDMMAVADIADHFVSAELEVLRLEVSDAAHRLTGAERASWPGILTGLEPRYPHFFGMAVFDETKRLTASAGLSPAPLELIGNTYIRRAFEGEKAFSSTCPSENEVVFYLAAPIPETQGCVLVATIPGLYFSERLSTFTIWETGHIFIDDSEGTVIANFRSEWVQQRVNFIRMAAIDRNYSEIAAIIKEAIQGKTGIGRFVLSGVPRICAYRPIAGSAEGWVLGVIAPLPESPIKDTDKGLLLVGFISIVLGLIAAIIASDIIRKPFEEVAALKELAEANSQSKSIFLANMSHEMRTPLNAVIGLSELTLGGDLGGKERQNVEKVYTAGVTLLSIINDILDISKIESGKFELNPHDYDMPSLINDTVTLNIMRKEEKPIEFKLTIDETLPSKLIGDELRIKQIFNNLLSNAFKYTKAGFVEWHITWEKSGDDIWLVSSVKDSGIGIREEDIQKLFQNYTQVDTKSHRKIEGTGLGLALTKRMVEQMDGSITVESEYGKGSKFSIRIKQGLIPVSSIGPAVAGKLQDFQYIDERQKRHAKLVRLQLPYARVLVVDDVPTNLDVVKGIMKPYGMKVDCASSGREAIKLVREGVKYNAIFMDQMMPEMDGLEATSIIRNEIDSEYAKTVPIIALTANAVIGNEELFLNSGFQAFLSKPIDITLMDAIIRQWVRDKDHNMLVEQIGNDSAGQVADNGIDGVDLDALLYQFGGEDDTLKMVLNSYAQNISTTLERVKAFDPEKVSDYATSVHGIKGVSRGICAEKVGALAEQLEKAGKAGDLTFIEANNAALIAAVEKLISDIKAWLG